MLRQSITSGALATVILFAVGCSTEGTGNAANGQDKDPPPAVPLHQAEIIRRIDLRKLPFMEGNSRHSATIATYGFSMEASSGKTPADAMAFMDKILKEKGCERFASRDFDLEDPKYGSRLYQHGDLVLLANCGTSRGTNGPDLNTSITVVGNFDVRAVPVPDKSTRKNASPTSAQLESEQEILELRKFYTEAMKKLGWHAYRDYIPGIEISVEDQLVRLQVN
ncbi:MAG: hypothetical protein SGJ20_08820 [Planctomycetota bacterium]|nr:hypothetical protein [Planctomycetota bacterium]